MSSSANPAKPGILSSRSGNRRFFLAMAALMVAILALAFVPEFVDFARGTFPIAPILHVHAALMGAWVAAFIVQAWLGATGRTALHRRLGNYAFAIGWLAWASMVFVEFRAMVVYPVPAKAAAFDWNLPGPFIYLTFPIFLTWAYVERRRPAWHKRLITFALFLTSAAAAQRFQWLPRTHGYLPIAVLLDAALLLPLAAYDLIQRKGRLHPATVRGAAVLLGAEAILFLLWGSHGWESFAASVSRTLHG